MKTVLFPCCITNSIVVNVAQLLHWRVPLLGICSSSSSSSSVFYFCAVKINKTQQHMISNANGRRKGKKRQNDQRCDMLERVKLEDEGISRHGRNTRVRRRTIIVNLRDSHSK